MTILLRVRCSKCRNVAAEVADLPAGKLRVEHRGPAFDPSSDSLGTPTQRTAVVIDESDLFEEQLVCMEHETDGARRGWPGTTVLDVDKLAARKGIAEARGAGSTVELPAHPATVR